MFAYNDYVEIKSSSLSEIYSTFPMAAITITMDTKLLQVSLILISTVKYDVFRSFYESEVDLRSRCEIAEKKETSTPCPQTWNMLFSGSFPTSITMDQNASHNLPIFCEVSNMFLIIVKLYCIIDLSMHIKIQRYL